MQYMPPALPFQKYLHNIYKIFTKYYNCSNAIHATSSAISKYIYAILNNSERPVDALLAVEKRKLLAGWQLEIKRC